MHNLLPQMLYLVELTDSRYKGEKYNMINSFINFISNSYVLIVLCVIFVILDFIVAVIFALFNKTYSSTKARQGFLKIFSYFATIRSQGAKITAISVKFRIIMQNTLYYKNVKKSIFFQNKFALRDFA